MKNHKGTYSVKYLTLSSMQTGSLFWPKRDFLAGLPPPPPTSIEFQGVYSAAVVERPFRIG